MEREGKMMSGENRIDEHDRVDRYYSILLLALTVSRQRWLAEEYQEGRIDEKAFLEAIVIESSSRFTSNDKSRAKTNLELRTSTRKYS